GFRLAVDPDGHKLAIWTFDALTVPAGVTIHFTGTNPAALVAAKTIAIVGVVDARGYNEGGVLCGPGTAPGPGGLPGGLASLGGSPLGGGPGGGLPPNPLGDYSGGAGGGGNGGMGGKGGPGFDPATLFGGDGGAPSQLVPALIPLVGGSGGGGTKQGTGGA